MRPIGKWKRSMMKERKTGFDDVSMPAFGSAVVLRRMRRRREMGYAIGVQDGNEFLKFAAIIGEKRDYFKAEISFH